MPQRKPEKGESEFVQTLQIEDVLLMENKHNVFSMYTEDIILNIAMSQVEDNNIIITDKYIVFEMALTIKLFDQEDEEKLLLESYAKVAAIYSYQNINEWEEEKIKGFTHNFFRFSAITHIMAFMRQHFYSLITDSGYPRLILPLIKSKLDEEGEEEASKALNSK